MPAHQSVQLNTGASMPTVGLGTWKSKPGQVEKAVDIAIRAGYRHIDTAAAYHNEKEVGDGLKSGMRAVGIRREDIFLTTKLPNWGHRDPLKALDEALKKLQTPYLDMWLMHWPAPMTVDANGRYADKTIDWLDTWVKMEQIYRAHPEKVRAIGVSNIMPSYLERLLKVARIIPAVNQIESHPSCPQQELVDICRKRGISITAYSPLGGDISNLHENSVVKRIAHKYNVTTANVLISLQANREGVTVIPKSVSEMRVRDNLKIIDLGEEEIAALNDIHKTNPFRVCKPQWTGWGSLGFPGE